MKRTILKKNPSEKNTSEKKNNSEKDISEKEKPGTLYEKAQSGKRQLLKGSNWKNKHLERNI